jgi:hypothetical protein
MSTTSTSTGGNGRTCSASMSATTGSRSTVPKEPALGWHQRGLLLRLDAVELRQRMSVAEFSCSTSRATLRAAARKPAPGGKPPVRPAPAPKLRQINRSGAQTPGRSVAGDEESRSGLYRSSSRSSGMASPVYGERCSRELPLWRSVDEPVYELWGWATQIPQVDMALDNLWTTLWRTRRKWGTERFITCGQLSESGGRVGS